VDLNVDTSWEVELFELIYRAGSWIDDVEKTLMSADLKLVGSLFVNVNRAVDGELLNPGRKRNWTGDFSSSALGGLNDLYSGAIDGPVVKCAKANADFLIHDGKGILWMIGVLSSRRRVLRRVCLRRCEALPRST